MNCEQVKELLSAYLDKTLALEERATITDHLHTCVQCRALLEDYRQNDTLLAQLPRVSPTPLLRYKIFSSPEYLELTGTSGSHIWNDDPSTVHTHKQRAHGNRPRLVALPGGRQSTYRQATQLSPTYTRPLASQTLHNLRILQALIAACLVLTLGMGGFIYWNIVKHAQATTGNALAITPPANPIAGPIPAGTRFVFLRDGALWSAPIDNTSHIMRLTPNTITVAPNWITRPALPGRAAGNMLAYIDLQSGRVHAIRSDGQSDTTLNPALLGPNIQPAAIWDTHLGTTLLSNLAWSPDGSMLAFVADPQNIGVTGLYLYSTTTGTTRAVPLQKTGSVSHLCWSPDSQRIAFELTYAHSGDILDYNVQNHGLLTIASATPANNDTVETLDWSPNIDTPLITWSLGNGEHVHSIWTQPVGIENAPQPHELIAGDFLEAEYNRNGYSGTGSWLLASDYASGLTTIVNLGLNTTSTHLAYGQHIRFAYWSPDSTSITYLEDYTKGFGNLHIINTRTGNDTLIAREVMNTPQPAWSPDCQFLAYSTGMHVAFIAPQTGKSAQILQLEGPSSAFSWSTTPPYQLAVAISDHQQGIYVASTQHNTLQVIDQKDLRGSIQWTQIP